MDREYCIAMTTIDDETAAARLARELVEHKLAACVQIVTVRSVFVWDGAVDDTPELLLLIKTRADRYEQLEAFIRDQHSYEVPEILQLAVARGFAPYLSWIDENTQE